MITRIITIIILYILDGIPGVKWFGSEGDYNVLVIDLLGTPFIIRRFFLLFTFLLSFFSSSLLFFFSFFKQYNNYLIDK